MTSPDLNRAAIDRAGPILARTLGRFSWTTYDHLGRLTIANLCAALLVALPLTLAAIRVLPAAAGLAGALCVWAVLQTALTAFALEIRRGAEPSFATFRTMARRWAVAGLMAHALCAMLLVVFGYNVVFWAQVPSESASIRLFGKAMAGLCVWGTVFVFLSYLYLIPLLTDGRGGVFGATKRAALLALDNAAATAGAASTLAFVEMAAIISAAGFLLLGFAVLSTMSAALYTTVLRKYERIEERNASAAKPAASSSWNEIRKDGAGRLDIDGEPVRSWREIWRPWE